jgi:hypothetical protein
LKIVGVARSGSLNRRISNRDAVEPTPAGFCAGAGFRRVRLRVFAPDSSWSCSPRSGRRVRVWRSVQIPEPGNAFPQLARVAPKSAPASRTPGLPNWLTLPRRLRPGLPRRRSPTPRRLPGRSPSRANLSHSRLTIRVPTPTTSSRRSVVLPVEETKKSGRRRPPDRLRLGDSRCRTRRSSSVNM